MRLEHYEIKFDEPSTTFEFFSEGPKGRIQKSVQFSPLGNGLYNLALGDVNTRTGELDDLVVTNNEDKEKVLATVVEIIYKFCERIPSANIFASGSTPARTRMYRMGINKYYELAVKDFYILEQRFDDEWESYQKGSDYQAFIVMRKKIKFGT